MSRFITYRFHEGLLDTVATRMKTIGVQDEHGEIVGRVVRGQIDGCEKTSTVQWETVQGSTTTVGIQRMTARTALNRVLRPSYTVVHGEHRWELKDRVGENILYFAVEGEVEGRHLAAVTDWDESVRVTTSQARSTAWWKKRSDQQAIGRFFPGGLLGRTRVQMAAEGGHGDGGVAVDPESATFGLLMLLPFMHRIYTEESGLIEDLLG